ncbi:hypothetical protein E2P81_ATG05096 [Venturia nashicola]|uniref:Uncharacterized protein n=1 Tax=Venturia nashicola TaxID=86259 RepID=A0A4Z1PJ22_9PEZI|nr:hypothetical protein E6O75_ATG05224 [Venturia nashicola]TLD34931.1 hypothetical protein E2P81_ATG05096 [Venturia nashicola]
MKPELLKSQTKEKECVQREKTSRLTEAEPIRHNIPAQATHIPNYTVSNPISHRPLHPSFPIITTQSVTIPPEIETRPISH